MTVQEFYDEVGGDYNDIMSRLRTEDRIKKFAGMFARDERRKPHWKPPVKQMKGKSVSSISGSGTVTVFLAGNKR